MSETVRFTFRLRPGRTAEAALLGEWGRCRWLWNEAVHQQKTGRKPTFGKLSKLLTDARSRNAWMRAGSQVAQQQTLRTYGAALGHSFTVKGRGRPKVKRLKDALPSLEYTTRGFSIKGGRLCLPNRVTIPVVWSRELPCDPSSVRVYRDSLGHWYASFVVRRDTGGMPGADLPGIGVDWGVKTTATTTDPAFDLPHLGYRRRCAAELAKAQRRMARRRRPKGQPPSKGYQTAKRQAARIARKAARQNTHDARVWAKNVTEHHSLIAVEDFKPRFLAKTTMARKAADAAIGACKRELVERGMRAGRKVVLVPPAYTTMTCSGCGESANHRLGLGVRVFECAACGYTADRDLNAARTILATAERHRASADDVRHLIASFRDGGSGAVRAGNPGPGPGGKSPGIIHGDR
ncbi:putative transposase [Actinoplanes campanulatus]|uniref:Putative transposase n=1 Tax=Actinoplanes campanulatus TaxID=113559 RepID=A0A7W5AHI0_9ACTN|nr:RNA-guided endonuclease TnpB family protein [Actinoplanes campanulatus]MBB3096170.1 putative transposase [Actinoplanes campanulatus]GGN14254.1 transposase [Actinoplanes campanulatus]GID36736.1 transposase [Actinoplanes campanulatus]